MEYDIVCFSHLRWEFVFQRPQQLMTRLSYKHRVYYIEEPIFDGEDAYYFSARKDQTSEVILITPHFAQGTEPAELLRDQTALAKTIIEIYGLKNYIIWHYSPMSYSYSQSLRPLYRVYDCMDELSNFLFAPPALREMEAALLLKADIVFTGGYSLYEAKRAAHDHIFCFPSSIDKTHFGKAREIRVSGETGPADQRRIPGPRIGFFGVIDERMNLSMLRQLAEMRPAWNFILIGPVVKIDPASLPSSSNLHYLGPKSYAELPGYLAGWDLAMMPFALNASTQFISPTKTPEYLAGGVPVIAPSITDIVTPYFHLGLVSIADTPAEFIQAAEDILANGMPPAWRSRVNDFLAEMSWDQTVADMTQLIEEGIRLHSQTSTINIPSYV